MKKRNLFAATLIGLALAACSSVEDINGEINQNSEGAVVTLKLDMSNTPLTKGSPDATNQQVGSGAENKISNVTVVVDYGTTQKVFKNGDDGVTWTDATKTLEFKTPAGDATFYVYANVNTADDLSLNWTKELVSKGTDVSAYYANNSFFMSNQNGEGVEHTINEDTENNVTVNIERAAAKVTVESPADFTSTYGGKLSDMKFALGNKINKFYLLQQSTIASPTSGVQYLPADNQTGENDWKTVNLGKTSSGAGENYQELSVFAADYCMENVHTTYTQDITTYIKFNTTFTPAEVLDFETPQEANNKWTVKSDLKPVSPPASASDAPSFFVVLDGNAEYTSNYILKSDLYDNGQAKAGLTITATTGGYLITGIEGITKISDEYVSGKCFFGPIWINLNTAGNASPIYRNDWYHLKVTDIKLPGLPSEPGDGGNIPLTPDVDVTLTLTVLDWELEERNITLQ